MNDRTTWTPVILVLTLALPGCCQSLKAAYAAEQNACLERYEDYDRAAACVASVRQFYDPQLDAEGCE